MLAVGSFWHGLKGGRAAALAALFLYASSFLASSLSLMPLGTGLHQILDLKPGAAEIAAGGGLDLLQEIAQDQPQLFPAAMAGFKALFIVHFFIAIFLIAGVYSTAEDDGSWSLLRPFFGGCLRFFWPFVGILAINLLVLLAAFGIGGLIVAIAIGFYAEATDPGPAWLALMLSICFLAFMLNLWRNSVGYAQALYVQTDGTNGVIRTSAEALFFTLRNFIPVNLMTWAFNLLRGAAVLLLLFGPGRATAASNFASDLMAQACFAILCFLRVAEARAQVRYCALKPRY